jgi:hypothetical protein
MDQSVPQHGMSWTAHYFDRRLNSEGVSRACASKEDALRLTLAALAVVSPETVIRWHHAGFRAYWRSRSRPRGGRPKMPLEIRQLIRDMSIANPLRHASGSGRVRFGFRRPRGSKFAATAKVLAAERYFRPTFVLGVAGPSPPDCAPRYTGQLSRRIGRERTYCTCPPANPVAGAPRPTQGGDHASHSIYCRPAQGRMADQVR